VCSSRCMPFTEIFTCSFLLILVYFSLFLETTNNLYFIPTVSQYEEVGIGLVGFGILFSFLGVILFFDRGLLALGNV
jgi:hypothetical protein